MTSEDDPGQSPSAELGPPALGSSLEAALVLPSAQPPGMAGPERTGANEAGTALPGPREGGWNKSRVKPIALAASGPRD